MVFARLNRQPVGLLACVLLTPLTFACQSQLKTHQEPLELSFKTSTSEQSSSEQSSSDQSSLEPVTAGRPRTEQEHDSATGAISTVTNQVNATSEETFSIPEKRTLNKQRTSANDAILNAPAEEQRLTADSDEDETSDAPVVEETLEVDTDKEILDADSSRSPEEIGGLMPLGSTPSSIEDHFALCDGSIYMLEWQRSFDERWLSENASKYKKSAVLRNALKSARSQEFLHLLFPVVGTLDFDYPVVVNEDVIKWMQYFQTRGRKAFVTWLRRAEDVVPLMRPVLEKYGLPQDLVYLAMIESGFNNRAFSIARASGPWQFMRGTGKSFKLQISDYVDERRDPIKATHAAAQYLTYLYTMFGDWHLAAASYNAGQGRVSRAMRNTEFNDFFSLSEAGRLPNETRNYVPKLIAAIIISKNPGKFGFEVAGGSRAIKVKSIRLSRTVALTDLAGALNVDTKVLENLNPELRLGLTPPIGPNQKYYDLRVPESLQDQAINVIAQLPEPSRAFKVAARVRRKETLVQFAKRYGLSASAVAKANPGLATNSRLQKGQVLSIPVALGSGQYERLTASDGKVSKKRVKSARIAKRGKKATRVAQRRAAGKRHRD